MADMSNKLKEVMERAASLPEDVQDEIAEAILGAEEEFMHSKPVNSQERRALRKRAGQRLAELRSRIRHLQPEGGVPNIDDEIDEAVKDVRGQKTRHA